MLLFLNIGGGEMVLIVLAALLLFGGKKLPELARGLGRGIREFKDASESIKRDINDQINNFGKELDVSAPVNSKPISTKKQAEEAKQEEPDYSDGGKKEPDYQGQSGSADQQASNDADPTRQVDEQTDEIPNDTIQKS